MNDTQRIETLLAAGNGGSVTLARKDARELAQKLKARGEADAAAKLAHKLDTPGDVSLEPEEAQSLLEQLRASGRRWVFGSSEARELRSMKASAPGPAPELEPEPVPVSEPEPERASEVVVDAQPEPEPEWEPEPEPEPEAAPEPRRKPGFFRRLFGKSDE
jgi:hypothetical protein